MISELRKIIGSAIADGLATSHLFVSSSWKESLLKELLCSSSVERRMIDGDCGAVDKDSFINFDGVWLIEDQSLPSGSVRWELRS